MRSTCNRSKGGPSACPRASSSWRHCCSARPDPDQDALCQHIWGTVDRKYDASLATYISNLRSALGLRSRNGYVVSTVYNYGYRLERVA